MKIKSLKKKINESLTLIQEMTTRANVNRDDKTLKRKPITLPTTTKKKVKLYLIEKVNLIIEIKYL